MRFYVLHSLLGLVCLFTVGFIVFLGLLTLLFMICLKWNTVLMMWTKWLHLTSGYSLILFANVTTFYGVVAFSDYNPDVNLDLGSYNLEVGIVVWFLAEVFYQYMIRRKLP